MASTTDPAVVVLDACVLYPVSLRDLLLRVAVAGLLRVRWSSEILDEWESAVVRSKPELASSLQKQRRLMQVALTDAWVGDLRRTLAQVPSLPDPGDAHVVAAALAAGATSIVTFNLKDFPEGVLRPLGMKAILPDALLAPLARAHPALFDRVLDDMLAVRRRPPFTRDRLLDALDATGLIRTVEALRSPV